MQQPADFVKATNRGRDHNMTLKSNGKVPETEFLDLWKHSFTIVLYKQSIFTEVQTCPSLTLNKNTASWWSWRCEGVKSCVLLCTGRDDGFVRRSCVHQWQPCVLSRWEDGITADARPAASVRHSLRHHGWRQWGYLLLLAVTARLEPLSFGQGRAAWPWVQGQGLPRVHSQSAGQTAVPNIVYSLRWFLRWLGGHR